MSFHFSLQADSKAAAIGAAAVKLNEVVNQQPVHLKDQRAIARAIEGHVELLRDATMNEVVSLTVSGSCSATDDMLTWVNVSVSAGLMARPAETPKA